MQKKLTAVTPCDFCNPSVEKNQEILQTQYVRLIYPLAPIIPENVMIIPIKHVSIVNDLTPEEILDIFALVKKVDKYFQKFHKTTAFNLVVNCGKASGQHIPHVHFHFFGRSKNESISPYTKMNNYKKYPMKNLSDEKLKNTISKIANRMKQL